MLEIKTVSTFVTALFCSVLFCSAPATAQDGQRWFQIEVSIFSNEVAADRNEETWSPNGDVLTYPGNTRRIDQLLDLLMIDDLIASPSLASTSATDAPLNGASEAIALEQADLVRQAIAAVGPAVANPSTGFRFFDFQRDPYVQLPPDSSDFQQTNRALERSAQHRLLFHGLWRQPMPDVGNGNPIHVTGGSAYGAQHELQGTVTLHFNQNRDRVVVDADLWLTEFEARAFGDLSRPLDNTGADNGGGTAAEPEWILPALPEHLERPQADPSLQDSRAPSNYSIRRLYRFQQSRDMRSTEFHYLDHPAMGLVILVNPYQVPELPPVQPGLFSLEQRDNQ